MIIAIDYDNTYTASPELWNQTIQLFQGAGHTVICVTGRSLDMSAPVQNSIGQLVPVIYAGSMWKREAAKKAGYIVNVWIDDSPEYVGEQMLLGKPNG